MKFDNVHDEYLWDGAVVSGVVSGSGDVAAPTGWFAPITLVENDENEEEQAALKHYGTLFLIIHENNDGFVSVLKFDTREERDERITDLEQAYGMHLAGIDDETLLSIVSGYQSAAEEPDRLDGEGESWHVDAQRVVKREVTEFVLQNADELNEYLEAVGKEWPHVGAQFYRARNGELGFASDAAGPLVDGLVESAQVWGPQRVHLAESGEIEIETSQLGTEGRA